MLQDQTSSHAWRSLHDLTFPALEAELVGAACGRSTRGRSGARCTARAKRNSPRAPIFSRRSSAGSRERLQEDTGALGEQPAIAADIASSDGLTRKYL
jgi:hypothetical protein